MKKWLVVMILCGLLIGCQKSRIEIYMIPYKTAGDIESVEDIELPSDPVITDKDMLSYDWQNHHIILKNRFLRKYPEPDLSDYIFAEDGSRRFDTHQKDYFVVVVDDKKIYFGNFKEVLISSFLSTTHKFLDTEKGFKITPSILGDDYRDNEKIYDVLKELNLIEE